MLKNGERCLAYTAKIGAIEPITGADNIELATVLGWRVIVKKGEFKVGDLCVYFEIDSQVPEAEWSEFLASKHFKIKTMKLGKFNVISQGLALPINAFTGVIIPEEEGADCTKLLSVTYANEEDNTRKSNSDSTSKYAAMKSRHKKLFQNKFVKKIMKYEFGRKVMFFFFGKKKDKPKGFPTFINKTDEERVENQPWRCGDGKTYVATEKLDGTSSTYVLERVSKNKFEFYVCSRNVRQKDAKQECYHDHNIYWDMAFKYNIEDNLKVFLCQNPTVKWVCVQGESVGSVQGNKLQLKEDDLYVFNLIDSETGRWDSIKGKELITSWGMKWVPILGEATIPATMEETKLLADGYSAVTPTVLREGIVYRSLDGKDSFKNVSRQFLLKHHE